MLAIMDLPIRAYPLKRQRQGRTESPPFGPSNRSGGAASDEVPQPAARRRLQPLQQRQDAAGRRVGLGQHRLPRLLQDLGPGQRRRLGREVRVHDPAARR